MTPLTEAASDYLAAGLEIIALTGKRPNITFHPHGLTDAMSGIPEDAEDDALIERVFTHKDTTGVGILIPERMMVADVDSDEAAQRMIDLCGGIPDTAVAKTRNGLHFWFITPKTRGSMWIDKLLLRGRGSYVVAPPSEHPDGGTYSWIGPLIDADSGMLSGLEFLPDAIEALLVEQESVEAPARDPVYRTGITFRPGGFFVARELDPDALGGLKHAIINAEDGNQNNVIAWAAMTARDEDVPLSVAMAELLAAAVKGGHPERRARETIAAAYRRRPRG
jgi:hypothetical protein